MRLAAFIVIVATAAPAHASPELPSLGEPGELYMLVVTRGVPSCQRWRIDPEARRLVSTGPTLYGGDERFYTYTVAGHELHLEGPDDAKAGVIVAASTCSEELDARETPDAIVAGAAMWFRAAEGCAAAIAKHEPVATELSCTLETVDELGSVADRGAARARFEHVAEHGGTMFSVDGGSCIDVTFKAEPAQGVTLAGLMSYPIVGANARRGRETYGYRWAPNSDQVALLGPTVAYENGMSTSSFCGEIVPLGVRGDSIDLHARLYFTRDRCQAQLRADRARKSWFPATRAAGTSLTDAPVAGGC